jgi:light-regulated signal transduction histidine kinase (bacteriophytochrome)
VKYRSAAPPAIHISAEFHEPEWLISVRDNGIGIEPEYAQQIFGIFKRLHGQKYPGSGIGLAICQRIVETYGGSIWVESQVGAGSVFRFTLPAYQAAPEQSGPTANAMGACGE